LDRDGVLRRFNVTPRVGGAVLLDKAGTAVIRGGFGLFYERTPSTVGAFAMFPNVVDARYQLNGTTPVAPAVTYTPAVEDLRTPRARTWDIGFDYRVNAAWSIHAGVLDRQGRNELIVDPVRASPTTGQLLL